jgi:D-alanyl-D-alanine carboxypeptidase
MRLIWSFVFGVWSFVSFAMAQERGSVEPLPDATWVSMQGKSFHAEVKGCAQQHDLVLLHVPYWNFEGQAKMGQLIVHKSVSAAVLKLFTVLYTDKTYKIARMDLIDVFGGDDRASMNANNTSGYNCRVVAGSARLSSHARGLAIDINPFTNPYVWKKGTSPPGATAFDTAEERQAARLQPGMILADSPITKAFTRLGWGWGGAWKFTKDYQHFSADGK